MNGAATADLPSSREPGASAPGLALNKGQVGMICFLVTEVAFFSTLVVTYLAFLEESRADAHRLLRLPLVIMSSICLFSSSATVHQATKALHQGRSRLFHIWWGLTIVLGAAFLAGTGVEWNELIRHHGLRLGSSLFGTTYFTLVGFHAFHVTLGVILMLGVLVATRSGVEHHETSGELISWYWHFVDGVWVVVFCVVYLLSATPWER